jgi:hypothetical protein
MGFFLNRNTLPTTSGSPTNCSVSNRMVAITPAPTPCSRSSLSPAHKFMVFFHNRNAKDVSQLEVDGALARVSTLHVGLGVGGSTIASGSRVRTSHSCDGWVCDLCVVGVPLIFGLARRSGSFAGGLMTSGLVSGFQLAQHNRGKCHFFSATFHSQLEAMVAFVDFSFLDLVFFFRCF